MANDGNFVRLVFRRDIVIDMLPKYALVRLVRQWQMGKVPGVNEKVMFGFRESETMSQKGQVVLRNILQTSPVTGQSRCAAMVQPELVFMRTVKGAKHHDFVVADEGDQFAFRHQIDQSLNYCRRLWTAVDEVPQGDQHIPFPRLNGIDERFEGSITTVNVANGNDS